MSTTTSYTRRSLKKRMSQLKATMSFTVRIDNEYCDERSHPRSCHHLPPPYPLKRVITFQVTREQFEEWLASPLRRSPTTMHVLDAFGSNYYYHTDPHKWFGSHYPSPERVADVTVDYDFDLPDFDLYREGQQDEMQKKSDPTLEWFSTAPPNNLNV